MSGRKACGQGEEDEGIVVLDGGLDAAEPGDATRVATASNIQVCSQSGVPEDSRSRLLVLVLCKMS